MEVTLLIIGVLCLLAAIVGGGLKGLGFEFPPLKSTRRQVLLGLFGFVLILVSQGSKIYDSFRSPSPSPEQSIVATQETPAPSSAITLEQQPSPAPEVNTSQSQTKIDNKSTTDSTPTILLTPNNIDSVKAGIRRGKGTQMVEEAEDQLVISSNFPAIDEIYGRLHQEIDKVFLKFRSEEATLVKKITDVPIKDLYDQVLSNYSSIEKTLYEIELGEPGKQHFKIRVRGIVYVPSIREHFSSPWIPESSNHFALFLQRHAAFSHDRVKFPHKTNILTLEKNGTLILRNEHMIKLRDVTVLEVSQLIESWMYDHAAWEAIQKR